MRNLSLNQMENLQGGKFWGSVETCNTAKIGNTCYKICVVKQYIFWIKVAEETPPWEVVPC